MPRGRRSSFSVGLSHALCSLHPPLARSHRSRLMPFIAWREREGRAYQRQHLPSTLPSSPSSLSLRGATAGEGASESVPTHSIAVVGDMVCVQLDLK